MHRFSALVRLATDTMNCQQFFRVESMERSRVQGAFGLHSRQSGTLSTSSDKQPAPGTEGKVSYSPIFARLPRRGADGRSRLCRAAVADWSQIPSMPVVFEGEVPGDYFPYSLLAGVEKGFRNRFVQGSWIGDALSLQSWLFAVTTISILSTTPAFAYNVQTVAMTTSMRPTCNLL